MRILDKMGAGIRIGKLMANGYKPLEISFFFLSLYFFYFHANIYHYNNVLYVGRMFVKTLKNIIGLQHEWPRLAASTISSSIATVQPLLQRTHKNLAPAKPSACNAI